MTSLIPDASTLLRSSMIFRGEPTRTDLAVRFSGFMSRRISTILTK